MQGIKNTKTIQALTQYHNMSNITVLSKAGCAPCEALKQYLKSENIEFKELNAFDNPDIASKLRIRKVPTVAFTAEPLTAETFNPETDKIITGDGVLDQVKTHLGK